MNSKLSIQEQISQVEEEVELLCWRRLKEALEADEYNDEAKLAKDTLSTKFKKLQTKGATRAIQHQVLSQIGTPEQQRAFAIENDPQLAKVLTGKTEAPAELSGIRKL